MAADEAHLADWHARLGLKRLSRTWAKIELLAGLTAAGLGLFTGDWAVARADRDGRLPRAAWCCLFAELTWRSPATGAICINRTTS
jgi:hypothetical protein